MKWHLEFVFRSKVESWWEGQSVELWPNGRRTGKCFKKVSTAPAARSCGPLTLSAAVHMYKYSL